MGWDRWHGPAGPAGPAPVGPIPDGVTGEDEIAWISDRLAGCSPAVGSAVWAYREKLTALRAIRALGKFPTGAEPPRETPRDDAERRALIQRLVAALRMRHETIERKRRADQAWRAYERGGRPLGESILWPTHSRRYLSPFEAHREQQMLDFMQRIGTSAKKAAQPAATVVPSKMYRWVRPVSEIQKWFVVPAIFCVGGIMSALAAEFWPHLKLPLFIVTVACFCFAVGWFAFAALVVRWTKIVVTALLVVGWAYLSFAASERAKIMEATAAGRGDSLPLVVSRYNIKMRRAVNRDSRGRVIFDVPLVNIGPRDLRVYIYYAADIQPFVSILRDNADVVNAANAVKAQVRKKAALHKTESVIIPPGKLEPGGLNVTVEVQGPVVTDAAWKKIAAGDRYVYFYLFAAINDDPATSVRACGIGDGADIPPRGCPDGLETW